MLRTNVLSTGFANEEGQIEFFNESIIRILSYKFKDRVIARGRGEQSLVSLEFMTNDVIENNTLVGPIEGRNYRVLRISRFPGGPSKCMLEEVNNL